MTKLALFASGSGSNVENILKFCAGVEDMRAEIVVSEKKHCGAFDHAEKFGVDTLSVNWQDEAVINKMINALQDKKIDIVVLAGFMKLIPPSLISAYPDQIVNIHPALLPKYGGKGMYGKNVHKAVHEANENESGITIHLVNEEYDKGRILFQAKDDVLPNDDENDIERKVRRLEILHYPSVIYKFAKNEL